METMIGRLTLFRIKQRERKEMAMKTITKRILATILVLTTISASASARVDMETSELSVLPMLTVCIEAIEENINAQKQTTTSDTKNMYVTYEVTDKEGRDITDKFFYHTQPLYIDGEYQKLSNYCIDTVKVISKTTVNRLDRQITKEDFGIETLTASDGQPLAPTVDVSYKIKGTIYYDPNTYLISSISDATLSYLLYNNYADIFTPSSFYLTNMSQSSTLASNKLSATFSCMLNVNASSAYDTYSFGRTGHSFTIVPE